MCPSTAVSTINIPEKKNQEATPTTSAKGPATNKPSGVARDIRLVTMANTRPKDGGGVVDWIYAI